MYPSIYISKRLQQYLSVRPYYTLSRSVSTTKDHHWFRLYFLRAHSFIRGLQWRDDYPILKTVRGVMYVKTKMSLSHSLADHDISGSGCNENSQPGSTNTHHHKHQIREDFKIFSRARGPDQFLQYKKFSSFSKTTYRTTTNNERMAGLAREEGGDFPLFLYTYL